MSTIRDLEDRFGRESCLNSMQKLYALATKTNPGKREFVFQALRDMILRDMVANEEVTKSYLIGDGHNLCGFIPLVELKLECLAHFKLVVLPRAQISDQDRAVIAEVLADHATYNEKMLGQDVSWQGALQAPENNRTTNNFTSLEQGKCLKDDLRKPCHPTRKGMKR